LGLYWAYYGRYLEGDNVAQPGFWSEMFYIQILGPVSGKYISENPMPAKDGTRIEFGTTSNLNCKFAMIGHHLFYWSPGDKSFCVAGEDGTTQWISLAHWLKHGEDVDSMYASTNRLYLNVHIKADPLSALCFDPKSETVEVLQGVDEVRAHEDSDVPIERLTDGSIRFGISSRANRLRPPISLGTPWDGDADCGMLCWRDREYLHIYTLRKSIRRHIDTGFVTGPCVSSINKVIWISNEISFATVIRARFQDYAYDGRYLGETMRGLRPAKAPFYSFDPVIANIVRSLASHTKQPQDCEKIWCE
jgi:hypothetical protein